MVRAVVRARRGGRGPGTTRPIALQPHPRNLVATTWWTTWSGSTGEVGGCSGCGAFGGPRRWVRCGGRVGNRRGIGRRCGGQPRGQGGVDARGRLGVPGHHHRPAGGAGWRAGGGVHVPGLWPMRGRVRRAHRWGLRRGTADHVRRGRGPRRQPQPSQVGDPNGKGDQDGTHSTASTRSVRGVTGSIFPTARRGDSLARRRPGRDRQTAALEPVLEPP